MSLSDESISILPLSLTLITELVDHGFNTLNDLKSYDLLEIQEECQLSKELTSELKKYLNNHDNNQNKPIDSINKSYEDKYKPIITLNQSLDKILGGGIQIGQITELCGVPGIGKTQLAMQLAINVQIPTEYFNGNDGECIYIDTEGSFMFDRINQLSQSLSDHLKRVALKSSINIINFNKDKLLKGIYLYRIHDHNELIAVVNSLHCLLENNNKIRLVIIDSIAFPFRQGYHELYSRTRILSSLTQTLNEVAYNHHIAIVLTNHVTTQLDKSNDASLSDNDSYKIIPALGEQWYHGITNRLILQWGNYNDIDNTYDKSNKVRCALLEKSPSRPFGIAYYAITENGIRDFNIHNNNKDNNKRQRVNDA